MTRFWKQWTAVIPVPFLSTLLLCVGFMGFVAWDQSHWWRTKEDYGFGWLVPAFVAYVVHERWSRILQAIQECGAVGSPRLSGARNWILNTIVYGALVGGALMFVLGALYRASVGSSFPGTLALSLGAAGVMLAVLFIASPETEGAPASLCAKFRDDARVRLVSCFVFPAIVWLVSAPMVSQIEGNLSRFMLNRVTTIVFFIFDTLGMQIEQQGNVLRLPLGDVGVAEACSGIRSFTGCLFAGSFLAAVYLDSIWKKIGLVVAAIGFAFATNIIRSLFLTSWAYNYGPEAIEGTVHDVAGYAVLGLTVVGLLCMLPLFNLKFVSAREVQAELSDDSHSSGGVR